MNTLRIAALLIACLALTNNAFADAKKMNFTEALKKNLISVSALSTGGYNGLCLSLTVTNRTTVPMNLYIDPALIFRPADTNYQDLVLPGGNMLALKGKGESSIKVQTFCGKSYARGPAANLKYNFLKQGDATMRAVAKFIQDNKLYNSIGQRAIWSLTNNHNLSSVYDAHDVKTSASLVQLISKLTGRPIPQYYTKHREQPSTNAATAATQPVFNPVVEKYVVEVEWSRTPSRNMHVLIHRADGTLFREVREETITAQGHKVTVELDPKKVPRGKYIVLLRDDDNTVYQRNEVDVQ